MSELYRRGWHSDPYGVHAERYFYADNQPGRLVRDENRHEFYDDIPAGAPPFPLAPTDTELEDVTSDAAPAAHTVSDAPAGVALSAPTAPPETAAPTSGVPPMLTSQPVTPWVPILPSETQWEEPEPGPWRRSVMRLQRYSFRQRLQSLSVRQRAGVVALAVVLVGLCLFLLWSGSMPTPKAGSDAASAVTTTPPTNTAPSTTSAVTANSGPQGVPPMWEMTDTLSTSSLNLAAVSCPGAMICYAVGETSLQTGMVIASLDGGHTWHQLKMPNGVPPLSGVACPSPGACLAVGESTVISTTNEGMTWTFNTVGAGRLAAISCPSAQVCIAASVITPGGSRCQSGESFATQNAGATWNATQLGCFVPSGISCPAVNICDMVGTATSGSSQVGRILMSRNTGRSWTDQFTSSDQGSGFGGISCPSTQACVAAGWGKGALVRTVDGGSTWKPQMEQYQLGSERFYTVTCLSANDCLAVGSAQPEHMSQAGTWLVFPAPAGVRVLTGVDCPSASSCVAVGITELGSGVILSLVS